MSPAERRAKGRANPAAEGVERRFLAGEKERARREAARGEPVMIGRGAQRNPVNVTQGPNIQVPANFTAKQPIQQAAVPSIAPTPGDITGSQPAPAADAGRGGWMGGDNSGRITNPWNKRNNAPSTNGPVQGPQMRTTPRTFGEQVDRFTKEPRFKNARRGTYAAAGVSWIDSIAFRQW